MPTQKQQPSNPPALPWESHGFSSHSELLSHQRQQALKAKVKLLKLQREEQLLEQELKSLVGEVEEHEQANPAKAQTKFRSRASRDAFYRARELGTSDQSQDHSNQNDACSIDLPATMIPALRAYLFAAGLSLKAAKVLWNLLAAMMFVIFIGIAMGILLS